MQHFDDYQLFTDSTVVYPYELGLPLSTLGLLGESGEYAAKILEVTKMRASVAVSFEQLAPYEEFKEILKQATQLSERAEKLKRELRDGLKKMPPVVIFSGDEREELVKELGDTQHYIARNARHLQVDLSYVAHQNVKKLTDRQRRKVISGKGDNR
jgi:NTP pyrophosphatase (non-canonical NTP hydrolase)